MMVSKKDGLAPARGVLISSVLGTVVWILLLCWLLFGCATRAHAADFYFFGVDGKWIKEANWGHVLAGVASSVVTHVVGHMAYAYVAGMDVSLHSHGLQMGERIESDNGYSNTRMRNFARAGPVLQHGVNLVLLCSSKKDTDFVRGYSVATALETWTYKLRNGDSGDFDTIDKHGGNGDVEHLLFCVLGCFEVLRIEW